MIGQCEFRKLKLRYGPNANLDHLRVVLNLSEERPFHIESITVEPTTNEPPEPIPGSIWRSLMVQSGGGSNGVGIFFEEIQSSDATPAEDEAEILDGIKEKHCQLINDMASGRRQDLFAAARRGRDEGHSPAGREALEEEEAFFAWMSEQDEH